jgi:hypothetical protein
MANAAQSDEFEISRPSPCAAKPFTARMKIEAQISFDIQTRKLLILWTHAYSISFFNLI